MAFVLPLAMGGVGGLGGFLAGYMYYAPEAAEQDITAELKNLKMQSPHKELREELLQFNKDRLKKITMARSPTSDELVLNEMRERLASRRASVAPEC